MGSKTIVRRNKEESPNSTFLCLIQDEQTHKRPACSSFICFGHSVVSECGNKENSHVGEEFRPVKSIHHRWTKAKMQHYRTLWLEVRDSSEVVLVGVGGCKWRLWNKTELQTYHGRLSTLMCHYGNHWIAEFSWHLFKPGPFQTVWEQKRVFTSVNSQ